MRTTKLLVLLIGVIGGAACAAPDERVDESDAPESWIVVEDSAVGTPVSVAPPPGRGPRVLRTGAKADDATLSFLADHRALFGLRAPAEELASVRTKVDALSMTHVRLRQIERGVPVVGGEVLVHYDAAGRLTSVQQRYFPGLDTLDLAPSIDKARAGSIAIDALAPEAPELAVAGDPVLVVTAPRGTKPALAWQLEVRGDDLHAWQISVDAKTGAVIDRIDLVESVAGSGIALDGKRRPLEFVEFSNGRKALIDETRPARILTRDASGKKTATNAPISSSVDGTTWDRASKIAPGAAVDAHTNLAATAAFFAKTFGRKGWDDRDGPMNVLVHYEDSDGTGLDNAFFLTSSNAVAFGDGKTRYKPLAGGIDVVAHEFMHAVTRNDSALVYKDQSGALNESISDVFGAVVEHAIAPDPVKNWQLAEGHVLAAVAMRDMAAPEKYRHPRHMDEFVQTKTDNGGVHYNSSIPNHAAYLATVGGTHALSKVKVDEGIGWDNLAKVWYRANDTYLTSTSDFAAMAKATLLAAADLKLSQKDVDTIDCAWKAVGVTQGECVVPPPPPEPEPTGPSPVRVTTGQDEADVLEPKPAAPPPVEVADAAPAAPPAGCSSTRAANDAPWPLLVAAALFVLRRRRRARD